MRWAYNSGAVNTQNYSFLLYQRKVISNMLRVRHHNMIVTFLKEGHLNQHPQPIYSEIGNFA
ncbi:hypothetical protein SAMN05421821_10333 [Mucilaginibacter lappiensis]|uniref:Uncharacterized protein n=1 Tax=Mucilaginibacter lappiensis TaxID=354630 RepID=A0A1N6UAL2_9SPHI|nr:hypothetical protein [Mucilaginibacter lappiensis]MBB6126939.1 hypothetical protein [Mucilaginibacter lappiensis]SIQ62652.1 hypothetical protein SAMN05421821_10333 [Mucilaginibacter lappiensis]